MAIKIDYDSIPRSYREYLELMVKEGEYLAIDDEVDWDLEIGAICRLADETLSPSPIFNKIKDSPGFRAAEWGFTKSGTPGRPWCRVASNVGAPLDATLMEILEAYMHSVENNPVHPPKIVDAKDAPCKENKWVGDEIDLFKLPVPLQHAGDAERMLQSAGVNTCQTPDGKWTNWSINRSAVIDKNTMAGFWIPTTQHNGMIWKQWAGKGRGHALRHRLRRAAGLCLAERQPHPRQRRRVRCRQPDAQRAHRDGEVRDQRPARSRYGRNRHRGHRLGFGDAHGGALRRTRWLSLRPARDSRSRGRTSPV